MLLSYINLVVHDVHLSMLGPPHVHYTRESLSNAGRSSRTGSILSVPPHSMVRSHSESCGIPVALDDFRIIGSTSSAIDLRIIELSCQVK